MLTLQFLIMTLITALNGHLFAEENFLVYDVTAKEILCERGPHCDERIPPNSSFKIALNLIGFDSGILIDETTPEWP